MMRAITALLIVACAAVLSAAAQVQAQAQVQTDRRARIEARLKAADTDGDSLISRTEGQRAFPKQAQRFDEIDLNHDGYLSRDELAAFGAKHRAAAASTS